MKMNAEVLAVETNGDSISVKVQGRYARDAEWQPWAVAVIQVPDTLPNRRALYVGRRLHVTVTPR